MPPWVASVPRSTPFPRAKAIDRFATLLRCRHVANPSLLTFRTRSASTHVSPTAINYRPNIPPRNEDLYNALSALSGAAEQYVNLSRLQLALRGLTVEDAVTRVAVLGLNGQMGAQRLARLLVADPLGQKEEWEERLEKGEGEEPVLLRFGDETDAHPPSPLYRVLSIPSRVLGMHRLELLVSTFSVNTPNVMASSTADSSKDAILVPRLQATSARGTPVPYPVHKTLILGEGLDSAIAYGKFTSDSLEERGYLVKVAIDLPAPSTVSEAAEETVSAPINIATGTEGLDALRVSVANSITYERNWFASGLPALTRWLTSDLQPTSPIKPAQRALIASILDDVEASIMKEDAQQLARLTSSTSQDQLGAEMVGYLEQWAEKSHRELRDSLDEAFTSKNWRKLGWWKLFWRVDDVGMILEEVLERRWLVGPEKEATYLAGRMKQAGYPDEIHHLPPDMVEPTKAPLEVDDTTSIHTTVLHDQSTDLSTDVRSLTAWPSLISTTRTALIGSAIPPLQALAQRLILTTLSTTSLSSALSALLYVSVSTVSLFEAGAIAALGFTLSIRRMQKVWEDARERWALEVREEGRQVLKRTEDMVKGIVGGGKSGVMREEDGVEERRGAREAVGRVREVLGTMGKGE